MTSDELAKMTEEELKQLLERRRAEDKAERAEELAKFGLKEGKVGDLELMYGYGSYNNPRWEIRYKGTLLLHTTDLNYIKEAWERYLKEPPKQKKTPFIFW